MGAVACTFQFPFPFPCQDLSIHQSLYQNQMGVAVLQPRDCLKTSPSHKPLLSPAPNAKLYNPNHKPNRTRPKRPNSTRPHLHMATTPEGLYAGYSMLVASPPPSSVPLPLFLTKKVAPAPLPVRDATGDLRRLLRLDFS